MMFSSFLTALGVMFALTESGSPRIQTLVTGILREVLPAVLPEEVERALSESDVWAGGPELQGTSASVCFESRAMLLYAPLFLSLYIRIIKQLL